MSWKQEKLLSGERPSPTIPEVSEKSESPLTSGDEEVAVTMRKGPANRSFRKKKGERRQQQQQQQQLPVKIAGRDGRANLCLRSVPVTVYQAPKISLRPPAPIPNDDEEQQ